MSLQGLAAIRKRYEEDNAPREGGVKYLKLKDGETLRVRFLQEFDKTSPGYNEKAGLAIVEVEHHVDGDFKNRFACTYDDLGRCYGCERHNADFKSGNRQKSKMYINTLVEREGQEPEVLVLSQGFGDKSVTGTLLEYAGETGVTDQAFKIKRKGSTQTDTGYTLISTRPDAEQYDVTPHLDSLFDLTKVTRHLDYDEQKALYGQTEEKAEASLDSTEW